MIGGKSHLGIKQQKDVNCYTTAEYTADPVTRYAGYHTAILP